jgi:hypothetical protein
MTHFIKKYIVRTILGGSLLTLSITSIGAISFSQTVEAADYVGVPSKYTLLEPLPCIPGEGVTCTAGKQVEQVDFKEYVQYMFNLLIAMAAVSAVFMIVYGGFQYMTSDAFNTKNEGLAKAKNAILGLLLVLCSFLILQTIDPRLVQINETFVPALFDCKGKDKNNPFCTRDNLNDVFKGLQSQANYHAAESEKLRQERERLQKEALDLQARLEELDQEYLDASTEDDPIKMSEIENKKEDVIRQRNAKVSGAIAATYVRQIEESLKYDADNKLDQGSGFIDKFLNSGKYKKMYLRELDYAENRIRFAAEEGKKKLEGVSNPADTDSLKKIEQARDKAVAVIVEKRNIVLTETK